MADLFIFIIILSSIALVADIIERVLTYKKEKKEANNERMVTIDCANCSEEDIMKANEIYEKIMAAMIKQDLESYIEAEEAIKGVDNMDYVELNGEKIPYDEENQE